MVKVLAWPSLPSLLPLFFTAWYDHTITITIHQYHTLFSIKFLIPIRIAKLPCWTIIYNSVKWHVHNNFYFMIKIAQFMAPRWFPPSSLTYKCLMLPSQKNSYYMPAIAWFPWKMEHTFFPNNLGRNLMWVNGSHSSSVYNVTWHEWHDID